MSRVRILALTFCLLNIALWFAVVPLGEAFDARHGLDAPFRHLMFGVQELIVYFDPWLSVYFFPVVYTLGFILLAWLIPAQLHRRSACRTMTIALIGLE